MIGSWSPATTFFNCFFALVVHFFSDTTNAVMHKYITDFVLIVICYVKCLCILFGSGYFAVDGNLPLESILP